MSCEDFERSIYLYEELSASEKNLLNTHLQACASCAAVFEEVSNVHSLTKQIAAQELIPSNAARLTSNVMSKIVSIQRRATFTFVGRLFILTRLAFTLVSAVLLIGFSIEFMKDSDQSKKILSVGNSGPVILNARLVHKDLSDRKTRHLLFADCRSPWKATQFDLNCVKSKLK
jgi:predicted anti-sigma-YlaC factor YlaD